MRRGPRWSHNRQGPLANVAAASMVPKPETPPHPCGGSLVGPEAMEAPAPMQRGPRWSHSGRGARAHAAGASVIPK